MTKQASTKPGPIPAGVPALVRYQMLVEQIPAVTYIAEFSEDAPFIYVSPQIEELLGYAPEEWIADQGLWSARMHPEDRERVLAHEARTTRNMDPYEGEFRMIHRDGRVIWIWERDTVIREGGGLPTCTQGVLIDMTELTDARAALASSQADLREERDRAQGYLDIAATMIVVLDANGIVTLVNRRTCSVLGYDEKDLLGRSWFDVVIPPAEHDVTRATFLKLMAGETEHVEEFENLVISSSGEERLIAWHNTVVHGDGGSICGTLSSGDDITERRRAQLRVSYLAYHDSVTGLGNREMMVESLSGAVADAHESAGSASLLCIDIDDFKLVNDSLGHGVGDELLTAVARRLDEAKRHNDVLARASGNAFLCLVPGLPSDGGPAALAVARRLVAVFAEPIEIAGAELHVSASVGVSVFPRDAASADELMRHADTARYQAKRANRSGIALYAREDEEPLERLSLTSRLRHALDRGELALHYQPIFSLAHGRPIGVEALLRWDDPTRGPISPATFIPIAEHSGLIEPIGEWVVETCCRQAAAWR
ncbi:MAG TPA: diguanylate cyclase, partial [Thermoleophilaceae bacterium]|nr:diguanylate cyclase [Thermoleophilaceae bacterium]